MVWPTPQDYNEAIQSPRLSFSDPELQTGVPDTTSLGLPRPITGNFASVYRMHCGGRDWAVRCFWRDYADMQERYAAISAHLAAMRLPYTVGFEYQRRGLRVGGEWYPMLKMEWVEGELLNEYIAAHLHDGPALDRLAAEWSDMLDALERSGCAHGDLQHGNVLVTGGGIKLVDYDCMFVPALRGKISHELGHQNFQHPGRAPTDFGPHLDRFSGWVIYLSIHAVRADPALWQANGAGDERLLFRREDFQSPESSSRLHELINHPEVRLRGLSVRFKTSLDGPLGDVPPLNDQGSARAGSERPTKSRWEASAWRLLWQSVAPSVPSVEEPDEPPMAETYPPWLLDHLTAEQSPEPKDFRESVARVRVAALASLALAAGFLAAALAFAVPAALAVSATLLTIVVANAIFAVTGYRRHPTVVRLLPLARAETAHLRRRASLEKTARQLQRRRDRLSDEEVRAQRQATERRDQLDRRTSRERAAIEEGLERKVQHLNARLREVDSAQNEEISAVLAAAQAAHVEDALRAASLRLASIRGFGWPLKVRLWSSGVWSAADVTSDRIRGLQGLPREALMALVAWRVDTEQQARRTMPQHVSPQVKERFRDRYALERGRLLDERNQLEVSARDALALSDERHRRESAAIEREIVSATASRDARRKTLEERILETCGEERCLEEALEAIHGELCRLGGVTFAAYLETAYFGWLRTSVRKK